MTEQRFTLDSEENGLCKCILMDGEDIPTCEVVKLLNELNDECEFLKIDNKALEDGATKYAELCHKSLKENEQLKQDNNALIHLLENQSMIIQELHSKLLEYQIKEPIVLTKEDLELMDKAISYYTHGRYGE